MHKLLKFHLFIECITIFIFFLLPYFLFKGKLFVGGDDTRLIYAYPYEYLKSMSFFSWTNVSSIGYFNPNHFSFPFAVLWSILFLLTKSRIFIDYLAFSLPLIIGFLSMRRLLSELIGYKSYLCEYCGALFFILSPIIIYNQYSVFLMSCWLVGLIPFIGWTYVKFLHTGSIGYMFFAVIVCTIFSLGMYQFPWIFGLIIPLLFATGIYYVIFPKDLSFHFIKKSIVYFLVLFISQAFWVLPILATLLIKGNNLVSLFNYAATFKNTVIQTGSGNIIYPLLNLPNRQLMFDYHWPFRDIFLRFYDKMDLANSIYFIVIIIGIAFWRKKLSSQQGKIYTFLFIAFTLTLFFFTVNIGFLKDLFLFFGYIPGFYMFRNFYDKFAPAYTFFYALVFTFSLYIVSKTAIFLKKYLIAIVLALIVINALPFGEIVDSPLWTTKSIYKNVIISQEYLDFVAKARNLVDPSANVLNLPLNIGGYEIIKEDTSNNVFAGTSPFKFFTGVNDYSGELSFAYTESQRMWKYINTRDYEELNNFFYTYNVGSLLLFKNIPNDVKLSYLFTSGERLVNQDNSLLLHLTDHKLLTSSHDGYELYTVKHPNIPIQIPSGFFKKINPVEYTVYLSHVKFPFPLKLLESFHIGWNIYLDTYQRFSCKEEINFGKESECSYVNMPFSLQQLSYGLSSPLFSNTHRQISIFGNQWIIDPQYIQKHFNPSDYKVNKDGSIDAVITIFFTPQLIFYLGLIISGGFFIILLYCFIQGVKMYGK